MLTEANDDPANGAKWVRWAAGFERSLWRTRLLVVVAVVALIVLAVGALALGVLDTVRFVGYLGDYARGRTNEARVAAITTIVKPLDGFLIAALLIVVAFGLYELFVEPIACADESANGRRLRQVHDLEGLKQRAGNLVVLVLIGELLQEALALPVREHLDLMYLGAGTVLVAAALYVTGHSDTQER